MNEGSAIGVRDMCSMTVLVDMPASQESPSVQVHALPGWSLCGLEFMRHAATALAARLAVHCSVATRALVHYAAVISGIVQACLDL